MPRTANLPVAFAALLAGGLLLEKGVTATKGVFGGGGTPAAGAVTVGGTGIGTGGKAPTPTGGKFSYAQLQQLWVSAGGNPAKAKVAAAVALAESAGSTISHATVGEDSRGLWQINVAAGAHPQLASLNLYNPLTNARQAVAISNNGTNWGPWTTFTSGRYLQFLH